jgi:hypothetical protein
MAIPKIQIVLDMGYTLLNSKKAKKTKRNGVRRRRIIYIESNEKERGP